MNRFLAIILLLLIFLSPKSIFGQDQNDGVEFRNYVSAFTGYTYVFNIEEKIDNVVFGSLLVPMIGVSYGYHFHPKFGLSFMSEVALGSFSVVNNNQETVVRDRAVLLSIQALYNFLPRWELFTGYGYEFEQDENLNVFRLGMEYILPNQKQWDVEFGLTYDYKEIYHTITFTISFSKYFGKAFKSK